MNRYQFTLTAICLSIFFSLQSVSAQTTTVDFESLPVPAAGFFNGDTAGSSPYRDNFTITGSRDNFGSTEFLQLWEVDSVEFFNGYTPDFGSWNGFSWSNVEDTTTAGFTNQYAAFSGGGSDGAGGTNAGETYAVGFGNSTYFNLPDEVSLTSIDLTNTTYSGLSMQDGDAFAKKFGGVTGNDEDFFQVTITGYDDVDLGGSQLSSIDFLLADYRFADNSMDYILDFWDTVDLSSIAAARSVGFEFTTTDIGAFGPATPFYVAIDNLTFTAAVAAPEPGGLLFVGACGIGLFFRRSRSN